MEGIAKMENRHISINPTVNLIKNSIISIYVVCGSLLRTGGGVLMAWF